jgi:hypothetical protein
MSWPKNCFGVVTFGAFGVWACGAAIAIAAMTVTSAKTFLSMADGNTADHSPAACGRGLATGGREEEIRHPGRDRNRMLSGRLISSSRMGGSRFESQRAVRRSTAPTEIVLGFFIGMIATLVVELPLVWVLHLLHLTARTGFSTDVTAPLGVEAMWSRVFWGGVFGIGFAAWGARYELGLRWFLTSFSCIVAARLAVDWVIAPMMLHGRAWAGWSADAILLPIILNVAWGLATGLLLAASTLVSGTWGWQNPT